METLSITTLTVKKVLHGDKDININDNIKLNNAVSKYIIATKDLTSFKSYTYVTNTTRSPLLMITSSRIVCFCNIFCLVYCCTNYNYIIHKLIILITPKPDLNEYMMMFIILYSKLVL